MCVLCLSAKAWNNYQQHLWRRVKYLFLAKIYSYYTLLYRSYFDLFQGSLSVIKCSLIYLFFNSESSSCYILCILSCYRLLVALFFMFIISARKVACLSILYNDANSGISQSSLVSQLHLNLIYLSVCEWFPKDTIQKKIVKFLQKKYVLLFVNFFNFYLFLFILYTERYFYIHCIYILINC